MLTTKGILAVADAGFAGLTVPRVGIFTNDFTPTKASVYADFDLAVYTGYANVTPTISAVFITADGKVSVDLSDCAFLGPTADAGVDGYGWFLFDNVTHDVWACERFTDAPLSLQNLLDRVEVDAYLSVDGSTTSTVQN